MSTEIVHSPANEADTKAAIFSPSGLQKLQAFAEVMAQGRTTVPAHLAGKPADCLAVALQAAQWGMNPFAVAQKTHLVNGTLGYEAQLVNAVITSSTAVQGRFKYEYGGNWENFRPGDKNAVNEKGLCVRVGAVLRSETEITWGEPLYMEFVATRNSPLWKTAPKQQLAYLAVKYWARLYCPDVILGVYSPDEFEQKERMERDVTPARTRQDLNNLINQRPAEESPHEAQPAPKRTVDELLSDFTEATSKAASVAELEKLYKYAARMLSSDSEKLNLATDVYHIRRDELTDAA
ncbi:DNA single-strand annealing protein RecT-like [Erwinia phage phiEt88]|uniref:RecT-like ssDNA annealing protein n=1 Tax=Erwinia phage phiEt88 TaxID=925984 RepID=UPI0001F1FC78|nr:RecT-like ssDNA annealing protein [Erwinia phage phiEt88]CBX44551.1 DNA single-strand annealing protein RecT-like [Erwinia phage phiEt88]